MQNINKAKEVELSSSINKKLMDIERSNSNRQRPDIEFTEKTTPQLRDYSMH